MTQAQQILDSLIALASRPCPCGCPRVSLLTVDAKGDPSAMVFCRNSRSAHLVAQAFKAAAEDMHQGQVAS